MITIGSGLVIGLLVFGKVQYKDKNYLMFAFKMLIAFSVYINVGYFLKVGSFELAYAEFLTVFLVIIGILSIGKIKIPVPRMLTIMAFVLTIIIGYGLLLTDSSPPMVLPVGHSWDMFILGFDRMTEASFSSTHIQRFIRITLFIALYYVFDMYVVRHDERTVELKKFVVKVAVIAAFAGVVEQFVSIIFSSDLIMKTARIVFGLGSSQVVRMFERGDVPALQGFMLEPGHYAQSFLPAILILFRESMFSEKQKFRIFVLFAYVLFFSGSFAGFGILLMMTIMYVFSNKRTVLLKLSVITGLATLPVVFIKAINIPLFNYYLLRITSIFNNESVAGNSDGTRMLSINTALDRVYDSPVFGIGFGSMDAFGFIPSMLVNFGIAGSFLWFIIIFRGFTEVQQKNSQWFLMLLPLLFFIGDTGMIYSMNAILIFGLVFRKVIPIKNHVYEYLGALHNTNSQIR